MTFLTIADIATWTRYIKAPSNAFSGGLKSIFREIMHMRVFLMSCFFFPPPISLYIE